MVIFCGFTPYVTSKATNEAGEVGPALRWRQGHRWRSLDGTGRCFYGGTMGFTVLIPFFLKESEVKGCEGSTQIAVSWIVVD
jgi:hypothetical protein